MQAEAVFVTNAEAVQYPPVLTAVRVRFCRGSACHAADYLGPTGT
jgi:hypothetical protein